MNNKAFWWTNVIMNLDKWIKQYIYLYALIITALSDSHGKIYIYYHMYYSGHNCGFSSYVGFGYNWFAAYSQKKGGFYFNIHGRKLGIWFCVWPLFGRVDNWHVQRALTPTNCSIRLHKSPPPPPPCLSVHLARWGRAAWHCGIFPLLRRSAASSVRM